LSADFISPWEVTGKLTIWTCRDGLLCRIGITMGSLNATEEDKELAWNQTAQVAYLAGRMVRLGDVILAQSEIRSNNNNFTVRCPLT